MENKMQDLRVDSQLETIAKNALIAKSNHIKFNNENYVIIKENDYNEMMKNYKDMDNEITQNLIEKEIAKEMPKDFDDVFIVAKSMLNEHPNEAEIRRTVREIKTRYPNLFIDVNEYFKSVMEIDD